MNRALTDVLLDFIAELRNAGVPISVAESLDAMRAITLAGLARSRLREALRASLIKDEAHRNTFERAFSVFFTPPHKVSKDPHQSRGGLIGLHGARGGNNSDLSPPPSRVIQPTSSPLSKSGFARIDSSRERVPQTSKQEASAQSASNESGHTRPGGLAPHYPDKAAAAIRGRDPPRAGEASRASLDVIERIPFVSYSPLEYQQAREALVPLLRQLRIRLGRRMRAARGGRIDLRRTLHAAVQRGGSPLDLRFRERRPKHIELVVLADISGSVQYASNLLLELTAGLRDYFRRVHSFVFIDQLAEADFEGGHLVISPNLDFYARSDFGRVLAQLSDRYLDLFNRATVMVIMGDGRNNRRSARVELLRRIGSRCRMKLWLNPEPVDRWGTGDSAINTYEAAVDHLFSCDNLGSLTNRLARL